MKDNAGPLLKPNYEDAELDLPVDNKRNRPDLMGSPKPINNLLIFKI